MTTIEYLKQIERYDRMIKYKIDEIERLKAMTYGISGGSEDDDVRVQHSATGDGMVNAVIKLVDAENEMQDLVKVYIAKRNAIIKQIDSIRDTSEYAVLTERYVQGHTMEQIASSLHFSRRTINRLHLDALGSFEREFGALYL